MKLTLDRPADVGAVRDLIASSLTLALSALSVYVAGDAFLSLRQTPPNQIAVELWRSLGSLVFAGLFALVGLFPRRMIGIWELILFHKFGQILHLIPYVGSDEGASMPKTISNIVLNDSVLVVVTATAYVLAKGWRAWRMIGSPA